MRRGARGAGRAAANHEPRTSCPPRSPPPGPARPPASGPARCARCSATTARPPASTGCRQRRGRRAARGAARACRARVARRSGAASRSWSASRASTATPTAPSRSRCARATPAWTSSTRASASRPRRSRPPRVQEGVHVVGLSILSGSHRELIPDVLDELRPRCGRSGRGRRDHPALPTCARCSMPGWRAVYTPKDFELSRIMRDIVGLSRRAASPAAAPSAQSGGRELGSDACVARAAFAAHRSAEPARECDRGSRARAGARRCSPSCRPGGARRRGAGPSRGCDRAAGSRQVHAAVGARCALARAGRSVAVLAVDPSSKRSGGSLLGDRARIEHDPRDDGS